MQNKTFLYRETGSFTLKVPSGQIGSAWEWYHWKALLKDINRYMFLILIFDLEYLKQLQSSEPLHAKRPLILLLVRLTACMCSSRDLFRQTVFHKCGRGINCSLGCGLHPSFRNPHLNRAPLWWIFLSNNSAPANRKTAFYANREPNKQEDWVEFCMKRLRTLKSFKIFKSEIKKLKTYSGWCPFQGLFNDTTLI